VAGDSWRTAGRSGAQVVEEYPGVPPEYPQSTPRGPPSPAAGKSIEDFSQFIEEAEVRCARVLQSTPTVPEARGALRSSTPEYPHSTRGPRCAAALPTQSRSPSALQSTPQGTRGTLVSDRAGGRHAVGWYSEYSRVLAGAAALQHVLHRGGAAARRRRQEARAARARRVRACHRATTSHTIHECTPRNICTAVQCVQALVPSTARGRIACRGPCVRPQAHATHAPIRRTLTRTGAVFPRSA
jgi:hypothetical protein